MREDKVLDRMLLKELLDQLGKDERQLIFLRYFANKTQTEVGEIMGISQVQVSRTEKKILKKLSETANDFCREVSTINLKGICFYA